MLADETPGLHEALRHAQQVADEIEAAFAFQAADVDELERETGLGDDLLLKTALRADEDDPSRRIAGEILTRDGDRGIDVSPRPTASDHQHAHHALTFLGFSRIVGRNSKAALRR